jgi:hypothetical protein
MARRERMQDPVDRFASEGEFHEQMVAGLRNSPWWMVSIAFHVVLGLILSSFTVAEAQAPKRAPLTALNSSEEILEEPPEDPEPIETIEPLEVERPDEVIKDDPVAERDVTDNDLEFDEPFSEAEGPSDVPLEGPQDNGKIGTGGNAGGAFPGRGGDVGTRIGRPRGKPREDAVLHALKWLAAHQSADGAWEAAGFHAWCDGKPATGERPDGPGKAMYDAGVTGLALCAFLGAGYTSRGEHEFATTVRKGLAYLRSVQDAEGCFGPRSTQHYIYNHACASLAMVEAYGMTESVIYRGPAQRALDFIALTRNPYFVWRYGVKPGDNDSSVTGWMMMALKSARLINEDAVRRGKAAPLTFDEDAFAGIRTWLDKMTDPDYGRVGYLQRGSGPARPQGLVDRFPAEKSESMTAVGMLGRIFLGDDPRKDPVIKKGVALCSKLPPTWNTADGSIDMYYWYYATLAMFQVGGPAWDAWDAALTQSMVAHQRMDGTYCGFKGSWDPVDPWGEDGGRVYSTAVLAMCLEVVYRYDRVFGTK